MPRRFYRRKRRGYKRRYKPKRFTRKVNPPRNLSMVKMGQGFPKKMTMKHKYYELVSISSSTSPATYIYSCNGMYDPNISGSGHSPRYFKECGFLYRHYTVIGSRIEVYLVPKDPVSVSWQASLMQNDDSAITVNNPIFVAETFAGKYRMVPANSNSRQVRMVDNWSAKKTFGGSVLGNDNLQGTLVTNPAEQTFWQISVRPSDNVTLIDLHLQVYITYIAVWDELADIPQS